MGGAEVDEEQQNGEGKEGQPSTGVGEAVAEGGGAKGEEQEMLAPDGTAETFEVEDPDKDGG